ncbi:hypothetical protein Tco_0852113 [Tanacetum coccineum]
MTPEQLNSGLAPSYVPATTNIPPTNKDMEILFQSMFDEYFEQSTDSEPVPTAIVVNKPIVSTNTSVSTMIAQDAPPTSHLLSSLQVHPSVFPQGDVSLAEPNQVNQLPAHLRKWTKDHPLDNIVGNPSRLDNAMSLTAYADADHAGCQDSRRKRDDNLSLQLLQIATWFSFEGKIVVLQTAIPNNGKCNRVLERQKKLRNQIFRALTASADVPSSWKASEILATSTSKEVDDFIIPALRSISSKLVSFVTETKHAIYCLTHSSKSYSKGGSQLPASDHNIKSSTFESRAKRSSIESHRTHFQLSVISHTVGNKFILRVLRIILVILPELRVMTNVFDHEYGESRLEPTSNKLQGFNLKDGDVSKLPQTLISYSSSQVPQDGNKLLDDERLSLADDLKKAHDQNQNKSK